MKKNEWKKWIAVVGRMLLAYALIFAQGAWAAQNQGTKDKSASPQKAASQEANQKQSGAATAPIAQNKQAQGEEPESAVAEEKAPDDASHQGIKVHGHWTIEVKNPDGTLVKHLEFENAYSSSSLFLSTVLTRGVSLGLWNVMLATDGICQNGGIPYNFCIIGEMGYIVVTSNAGFTFPKLTVAPGNPSDTITFSGVATATYSGNVTGVQTDVIFCSPTNAPASPCPSSGFGTTFTAAILAKSLPVSAGQQIAVTVNISFS